MVVQRRWVVPSRPRPYSLRLNRVGTGEWVSGGLGDCGMEIRIEMGITVDENNLLG